ncbi:MAG: site-specific integrase [Clostridiales bacterium]|nr:site-specific integrase [Clostridiales bacterium]
MNNNLDMQAIMQGIANGGNQCVSQEKMMQSIEMFVAFCQWQQSMSGGNNGILDNNAIVNQLTERYPINQELEFEMEVNGEMKIIGNGSVYEIKNRNKWGVAYYFEDDNKDKKRKVNTFDSEKEAQRFLNKLLNKKEKMGKVNVVETGKVAYNEEHKLEHYMKEYLDEKKEEIKKSTYDGYYSISNVIKRYMGEMYLEELTAQDIKALFVKMRDGEHIGERKVEAVYDWLKRILKHARVCGIMDRDIMEGISKKSVKKMVLKLPEHYKKDIEIISEENMERLKQCMENDTYRMMIQVIEHTGLRAGEACALYWRNVDFENRKIHIVHNLTTRVDKNCRRIGNAKVALTTPKTSSSKRVVYMSDTLYEILEEWKNREVSDRELEKREECGTSELVFVNRQGNPIIPGMLLKVIKDTCKKNGIYETDKNGNKYLPHTHMIRHLTATRLLEKGVDLPTVSKILGHTDTQTTQIYITIREEKQKEAMKRLDK